MPDDKQPAAPSAPADQGAELPAWEAVYEPGNVSDYLIGYTNSEAAAKGAAEAWMRSQKDEVGRLEWIPDERLATGRYDQWTEILEHHDEGVPTGPGIIVRRRVEDPTLPAPADRVAVLREAADAIEDDSWSRRDRWGRYEREEREAGMCDAAALLRRMADETQEPEQDPIQLRWGLGDVMWGDDDSVTVMLSGPDGEPYWLELAPERAAALRRDLAGPDGAQPEVVHACPPDGSGLTPCCGRTPFELPLTDLINNEAPVTCTGNAEAADRG